MYFYDVVWIGVGFVVYFDIKDDVVVFDLSCFFCSVDGRVIGGGNVIVVDFF